MHTGHSRTTTTDRKLRVLMLSHRIPYPLDRGDRIRAHHILRHLSGRFDVSLAAASDQPATVEQKRMLDQLADRVAIGRIGATTGKLRGLIALGLGGAATPACFYQAKLARQIVQWHHDKPFDTVLT